MDGVRSSGDHPSEPTGLGRPPGARLRAVLPLAGDDAHGRSHAVHLDDLPFGVLCGRRPHGAFLANRRWSELTDLSPAASERRGWLAGFAARHRGSIEHAIDVTLHTGQVAAAEWQLASGEWVHMRIGRDRREAAAGTGWILALTGLAHPAADVAALARQASHDELTGLANRGLLGDRVTQALARRRDEHCLLALLYLDLDRFKSVNDGFGHAAGDAALRTLASRLTACLRPSDTAARIGGDEFVLLCDDLSEAEDALVIVDRALAAAAAPLAVGDGTVEVRASVGVAFGEHGDTFASLLGRADRAMFEAKARGGDGYVVAERVDDGSNTAASERLGAPTEGLPKRSGARSRDGARARTPDDSSSPGQELDSEGDDQAQLLEARRSVRHAQARVAHAGGRPLDAGGDAAPFEVPDAADPGARNADRARLQDVDDALAEARRRAERPFGGGAAKRVAALELAKRLLDERAAGSPLGADGDVIDLRTLGDAYGSLTAAEDHLARLSVDHGARRPRHDDA
jgi:diguanylate cyclase (GGDEF)-like protein